MAYKADIIKAAESKLPWHLLSGKKILITGATGLIGSTLVQVLMSRPDRDFQVFVAGRNERSAKQLFVDFWHEVNFQFLAFDVSGVFPFEYDFDIIIDAAGVASPQLYASNPVDVMKSNIMGVDNLLSYGIRHKLEQFIFVSSGEIYGEGDGRIFKESDSGYVDCASLRACYPSAKRASEALCISYGAQYGIDVRIARPCHVFGPNFSNTDMRVYAQFIRNVLDGRNLVLKSDGSQYRSWCYAVDCASALLFILLKGENGGVYNIADDNSCVTIRSLAETIANIAGLDVEFQIADSQERSGYSTVTKSVMDTEKLRSLGWMPQFSFEENLRSTIEQRKLI